MLLVTGGDGFIAKNLKADRKINRSDVDLTDLEATIKLFKELKPSTVIHCAARHCNFSEMTKKHVEYIQDNIRIDLNVFEACRLAGVKNLLAISSVTSFPENTPLPYEEKNFFLGDAPDMSFGYAYGKKTCVSLCKAYNKQYDLNYKSAILGNVYGPHNGFSENSTVVANLIHKCYNAKKNNEDLYIYGDGSPVRDFTYVLDLDEMFNALIKSKKVEPVIVSTSERVSIKTLVKLIVDSTDYKGNVIWGNESNMGQIEKYSNNSKLKSIINKDFSFTTLKKGIEETCEWYKNNA